MRTIDQVDDYDLAEFLCALRRCGRLPMLFNRGVPELSLAIGWIRSRPLVLIYPDEGPIFGIGMINELFRGKADVSFAFLPSVSVLRAISVCRNWLSKAMSLVRVDRFLASTPRSNEAAIAVAFRLGFDVACVVPQVAVWQDFDDDLVVMTRNASEPAE